MIAGVGFLEILIIGALVVIFVDPRQIPSLVKKSIKIINQTKSEVKKFFDDVN